MASTPCSGVPLSQSIAATTYNSAADFTLIIDTSEPDGKKLKKITPQYLFSGWTNGNMNIQNNTNGSAIKLSAKNSSGVLIQLIMADPNGNGVFFPTYGGNIGGILASTDALDAGGNTNILVNTSGGNITIGGIIGGSIEGQTINIIKAIGANTITINHLKVTGNQQIVTPTGVDYVLSNFESIQFIFNPGNNLWYPISK